MMKLSREQRFVLSAVRAAFGYEPYGRSDIDIEQLDWDSISQLTLYNGVASILHKHFDSKSVGIPDQYRKLLADEYMSSLAAGMLFNRALQEVSGKLKDNRIVFAVHKGVALSSLVYPSSDLRPPGTDIDLFVRKSEYDRVRCILVEIGYETESPELEAHEATYIGEVHFSRMMGTQRIVIDLHTDFNPNHWGKVSGFDPDDFWNDLIQVQCPEVAVQHLPVEPCLIFLAIHCAANHVFDRLINFCDIDLLIRKFRTAIDWYDVADFVKNNRCRKTVYHCLYYCRQLLDTPVPGSFLEEIRPGPLSIALVERRARLIIGKKPSKSLERYMHLVLLDNPLLIFRSVFIFVKRIVSGLFLKRR